MFNNLTISFTEDNEKFSHNRQRIYILYDYSGLLTLGSQIFRLHIEIPIMSKTDKDV